MKLVHLETLVTRDYVMPGHSWGRGEVLWSRNGVPSLAGSTAQVKGGKRAAGCLCCEFPSYHLNAMCTAGANQLSTNTITKVPKHPYSRLLSLLMT